MKLTHLVLGILGLLNLSSLGQAIEENPLLTENQATVTRMVEEVKTDDRYEDIRTRTAQFIDDWQRVPIETVRTELLKKFYEEDINGRDLYRLSPALVYAYSHMLQALGLDFLETYPEGFEVKSPSFPFDPISRLLPGEDLQEFFVEGRTGGYAASSSFVAVLACQADLAHDLLTQRRINPLDKILKGKCKDFFDLIAAPTLSTTEIEESELKDSLAPLSQIQQHNPSAPDSELAIPKGLLAG